MDGIKFAASLCFIFGVTRLVHHVCTSASHYIKHSDNISVISETKRPRLWHWGLRSPNSPLPLFHINISNSKIQMIYYEPLANHPVKFYNFCFFPKRDQKMSVLKIYISQLKPINCTLDNVQTNLNNLQSYVILMKKNKMLQVEF